MSRDPLARMDVDTGWAYHRKMRHLQRRHPRRWPVYVAAYFALLGEAWRTRSRDVSLETSWCPAVPCTYEDALAALVDAALVDEEGRVPEQSWEDWFAPVEARLAAASERGRKGAIVRWHSTSNGEALPEQSVRNAPHPPRPPRQHGQAPARAREDGGRSPEEVTFDWLCAHGAGFPEGNGLYRHLVDLSRRHGAEKVVATFEGFGAGLGSREYVLGAENALNVIPKEDPGAEREAERQTAHQRRLEATQRLIAETRGDA